MSTCDGTRNIRAVPRRNQRHERHTKTVVTSPLQKYWPRKSNTIYTLEGLGVMPTGFTWGRRLRWRTPAISTRISAIVSMSILLPTMSLDGWIMRPAIIREKGGFYEDSPTAFTLGWCAARRSGCADRLHL